ncbi:conserved Plasmodium protein, unknown function [Plasmodium gallinaceum]|uniref:PhIL1 interacting protein PIP2 n=1 Tax=Plasmodium gallinaceum TaxID=5849 RepID=A0A1J1GTN8_PLAGA|nr:conserved Plasmodium protein, unknown function [Plasmodium gallinaceum]CRG95815.1 conserved Plasmodium protein, unknown function [Plasmodium gallinaceum]
MEKEKNSSYMYQDTLKDLGEGLQNMETIKLNKNNKNYDFENINKGTDEPEENKYEKGNEKDNDNDNYYIKDSLNKILESNKDSYLKNLDYYKNNSKYKIDPCIHVEGVEEIENYIIKEKVYLTTYVQYIDVYEDTTNVEEDVEKEEVEYVEVPKYVTKYKPKIVTDIVEKTIEIPSGEEIKQPKYNTVDVPYIVPNIVENEILVVSKKIIQPEIEISNEVLEVEVEKYIPHLVPVNVYVPRYFGISAKTKGVAEESVKYVDLSQDQIDTLIKELNPHLDELKLFNENQLKRMDEYVKESQIQAKAHNFEPPQPQVITYDENGNCQSFDYSEFDRIKESYLKELAH